MARQIALIAAFALSLQVALPAAAAEPKQAQPLDPATAIIEAFKTYDIVALGEGNHINEQGATFRQTLYHDPRFEETVSDLVVEMGNAFFQPMMDRYIAGEEVPEKDLRRAWLETSSPNDTGDRAIYADVFHAIHDINLNRPKTKRLRVLLGDAPYDPSSTSPPQRSDAFTADLIQREVLAKKRKALVVYGDLHLIRAREAPKSADPGAPPPAPFVSTSITATLEKAGVKVFRYGPSPPQKVQA